jgi:hypothetical protein
MVWPRVQTVLRLDPHGRALSSFAAGAAIFALIKGRWKLRNLGYVALRPRVEGKRSVKAPG